MIHVIVPQSPVLIIQTPTFGPGVWEALRVWMLRGLGFGVSLASGLLGEGFGGFGFRV